jgi:large subunit ribosomal protein L21
MAESQTSTAPATAVSAYAIIETGGKQYRVSVGDTLAVEKLPYEPGADVTFDRVLMIGGDGSARVGTPLLAGATVTGQVAEQYRGPKIVVFKYKPKKRYRRRTGHRQSLTRVAITGINA